MTDPHALDAWLAAANAAADAAGAAIRPHFRARLTAERKDDESPVTIADRAAEQAMRGVLAEHVPDHGILGEEYGLSNPQAHLRWVLDPIDGTRAFITGRPLFGTLIALMDSETPLLGIIDQPITGERWVGAVGRVTTFRGPIGGVAGCRACPGISEAELASTSPDMFTGAEQPGWARLRGAVRRTSYGGDCYIYGLLALGQLDLVVDAGLKIWDWAALVPVIEGAGGCLTDWQGNPVRPGGTGHVIAAGDRSLLPQAIAALAG